MENLEKYEIHDKYSRVYARSFLEVIIENEIPSGAYEIITELNEFKNARKWNSARQTTNIKDKNSIMIGKEIKDIREKLNKYPSGHLSRYKVKKIIEAIINLETLETKVCKPWHALKFSPII